MSDTLALWEFPPEATSDEMDAIAQDRAQEPDAHGVLVSSRGDVITLQIVEGMVSGRSNSKFHIERRGGFEFLRREDWPAPAGGGTPRIMLTLRTWPKR